MMNPLFIFIIGASGSGKTTILRALECQLTPSIASINYFDDIGVPSVEMMVADYGSPEKWQRETTYRWMKKLTSIRDKRYIILEGSFDPEFAVQYLQHHKIKNYIIVCVEAQRKIREKRLIIDRKQPELASDAMENFAQLLSKKTIALGGTIIDSTTKTAKENAEKILSIIRYSL